MRLSRRPANSTGQDEPFNVSAADGVLKNDQRAELANLTTSASHGQVHLNGNGSFTYSRNGFSGYDSFQYTGFGPGGTSALTTVTITVRPAETGCTWTEPQGTAAAGQKASDMVCAGSGTMSSPPPLRSRLCTAGIETTPSTPVMATTRSTAVTPTTVYGGDGNDTVNGDAGKDALYGQAGKDDIDGGSGDDTISGGDGDDQVKGGSSVDKLSGDTGNDNLTGGADDDALSGGPAATPSTAGQASTHSTADPTPTPASRTSTDSSAAKAA